MPRFFTLPQARELLPRVEGLIEQAIEGKASYQQAEEWTNHFIRRVMTLGGLQVNREPFQRNREVQVRGAERLKSAVEEINAMGILVKDLDSGLIDFPTLYHDNEVYLCWKRGEDDIEFWHGVSEGFAGRKEIDREFVENHRGRESA